MKDYKNLPSAEKREQSREMDIYMSAFSIGLFMVLTAVYLYQF